MPHSNQGQPPHQRFPNPIQPRYDSQSSVFNLGWQPRPNFNYAATTQNPTHFVYNYNFHFHQNRQPQAYQSQPPPPQANTPCQSITLEDLVKVMAITQSQIQQSQVAFKNTTQTALKGLELQMEQITR